MYTYTHTDTHTYTYTHDGNTNKLSTHQKLATVTVLEPVRKHPSTYQLVKINTHTHTHTHTHSREVLTVVP